MMLIRNPLIQSERAYLRQIAPHRAWHYVPMIVGLLTAAIPLGRAFDYRDETTIQAMAVLIISLYWWFQFRILRSAVHLAKHGWQGDVPQSTIIFARVQAILWHHRFFIVMMSFALLGLSLALMGYLYYWMPPADERGIWRYVGIISIATGWHYSFPILPHPTFIVIAGDMLLLLTFVNSLLSISLGLWAGRLRRAFTLRLFLLAVMVSMFLGFYAVSASTPESCRRSWMAPNRCPDMLLRNRIVDSLQALSLTFLDGGASLVTGIYCPRGPLMVRYYDEKLGYEQWQVISSIFWTEFHWEGYQWRHLGVAVVTYSSQLALSGFFFWRSSFSKAKSQ